MTATFLRRLLRPSAARTEVKTIVITKTPLDRANGVTTQLSDVASRLCRETTNGTYGLRYLSQEEKDEWALAVHNHVTHILTSVDTLVGRSTGVAS
jgi:hypothetical protein